MYGGLTERRYANGAGLTSVFASGASTADAEFCRPSVFMRLLTSDKYPNYCMKCKPDDLVDGIGGYNCRRTVSIFHGTRRWSDDPCAGTGYTNDEVYKLRQKQRRLENRGRHLKRVREVLSANGHDTRELSKKIRANSQAIEKLVSEHSKVLRRERWRETTYPIVRGRAGLKGRVYLNAKEARQAKASVGANMCKHAKPRMSAKERRRVSSEINTWFHYRYYGQSYGIIQIGNYEYRFDILDEGSDGFYNYEIYSKRRIK